MINSFYTASVGVIQLQKGMDVVANNIANVNTAGYRPSAPVFSDLLYTSMQGDNALQMGHGSRLQQTASPGLAGHPQPTGRLLDYALTGADTYFGVITPDGLRYTRSGGFALSEEEGRLFLVSPGNGYVADANGRRVEVDPQALDPANPQPLPVGVYRFDNADGLARAGNSLYAPTDASGRAAAIEDAGALGSTAVRPGCLEGSAVSLADEMSGVIQLQRAFQLNTRMVQIADEIMQTVNSMR